MPPRARNRARKLFYFMYSRHFREYPENVKNINYYKITRQRKETYKCFSVYVHITRAVTREVTVCTRVAGDRLLA
jgi:hypothetical protein